MYVTSKLFTACQQGGSGNKMPLFHDVFSLLTVCRMLLLTFCSDAQSGVITSHFKIYLQSNRVHAEAPPPPRTPPPHTLTCQNKRCGVQKAQSAISPSGQINGARCATETTLNSRRWAAPAMVTCVSRRFRSDSLAGRQTSRPARTMWPGVHNVLICKAFIIFLLLVFTEKFKNYNRKNKWKPSQLPSLSDVHTRH